MRLSNRIVPAGFLLWAALCGPVAVAQGDDTCLACHDVEGHAQSLHGSLGVACVDCHADLSGVEDFPHDETLLPAGCGACHVDVQDRYATSMHGYALARGNERAPTCAVCHGTHDILPISEPGSPAHPSRVFELCATCHGTAGLLTDRFVRLPQTADSYARSVHGPHPEAGAPAAATCVDCHDVHGVRGPADPASRIHAANQPATCGGCHEGIQREYEGSIHGLALRAGIHDSPTCTDCHGEHLILRPSDPDSRTHASRLATEACGNCHNDPSIIAKYSLRGDVVGSYVDSYHGWTSRRGYASAATCVSCHTAHAVLPHTEEGSTIHPDNLVATCRQCHEQATEKFAASYTHEKLSIAANPINRWIRGFYWVLIAGVIGGMALHNAVIMSFHAARKRRELAREPTVKRLDRWQLAQHGLMGLSFAVLVITGFALRYPGAWWVGLLSTLGLDEPLRATVHRVAGVVMVLVAIGHVLYVSLARRGRREFLGMMPSRRDLQEAADNLRYHTGRRDEPADFGRYDYTQKAEYWALVWGTLIMVVTGLILWFPGRVVQFAPAWLITASQTVHYYEAWLALLAILVWHLFFVMLHPDEYPMNWTWLTGRMTRRAARKHHPRWYREELDGRDGE